MVESCNDEIDKSDVLSTMRKSAIQEIIRENVNSSFEVISNKIKAYAMDKKIKIIGVKDNKDYISIFLAGIEYQFKK
jgi:hypothetical protein